MVLIHDSFARESGTVLRSVGANAEETDSPVPPTPPPPPHRCPALAVDWVILSYHPPKKSNQLQSYSYCYYSYFQCDCDSLIYWIESQSLGKSACKIALCSRKKDENRLEILISILA